SAGRAGRYSLSFLPVHDSRLRSALLDSVQHRTALFATITTCENAQQPRVGLLQDSLETVTVTRRPVTSHQVPLRGFFGRE
ncbi:hypothetical protein AALO_G00084340, partial [Alosa alosa]